MTDALRFEWMRVRTLRSTYWLTALALVLPAAVAGIVAFVSRDDTIGADLAGVILTGGTAFSPLPFTAVFMGLVGVFAFGHEYRHGTILSTLTAVPRRGRLLVAKTAMVVAWSLAVAVVSVGISWLVAWPLSGQRLPLTGDPVGPGLIGYVCYVVLWGLLGLGLGALLRSLPAAIVIMLVVPLVGEPLLSAITLLDVFEPVREYVNYLPFTAGGAMTQTVDVAEMGNGEGSPYGEGPSRLVSGLTFTAWVAAASVPAWLLFHKRDA